MIAVEKINPADLEKAITCLNESGLLEEGYVAPFEAEDIEGTVTVFVSTIDDLSDEAAEALGKDTEHNFSLKFYNTLIADEVPAEPKAPKLTAEERKAAAAAKAAAKKAAAAAKAAAKKAAAAAKAAAKAAKAAAKKAPKAPKLTAEERKAAAAAKAAAKKAERDAAKAAKKQAIADEKAKRKAEREKRKAEKAEKAKTPRPEKERTIFGTVKGTQAAMIDELLLSKVGYTYNELAAAIQSSPSRVKSHMHTLEKIKGAIMAKDENGKWRCEASGHPWDPATRPAKPKKKAAEEAAPAEGEEKAVEEPKAEESQDSAE